MSSASYQRKYIVVKTWWRNYQKYDAWGSFDNIHDAQTCVNLMRDLDDEKETTYHQHKVYSPEDPTVIVWYHGYKKDADIYSSDRGDHYVMFWQRPEDGEIPEYAIAVGPFSNKNRAEKWIRLTSAYEHFMSDHEYVDENFRVVETTRNVPPNP